jgi:hypothetical protein
MTYTFGEFTLKPATWLDLPLAHAWTAADLDHYKTTPPVFWIVQKATVNSFLLWHGRDQVFFFRIDERAKKQVEIHIQFSGPEALRQRLTRRGLIEGFAWLEKMLKESGFEGYYFHSRNSQLISFTQKRLGFRWDGFKLYRRLEEKLKGHGGDHGEAEREEAQCAAGQ